jgi:hypothetical protein
MIRRRHVLSVLSGGVLAGCTTDESEPTVTPAAVPDLADVTEQSDRPSTDRSSRRHDVTTLDSLDRTLAVILTESTADPPVLSVALSSGPDRPPLLSGSVENPTSTAIEVDLGRLPTFSSIPNAVPEGGSRRDSLMLAPRAGHDRRRYAPPAERGADGWWIRASAFESPWVDTSVVTLEPNERVRFVYAIVGRQDGAGLKTGRYRFPGRDRVVALVVWQTSAPGPDVDSRFSKPSLPPLPNERRTVWYHDSTPEATVYLDPASERVTLPGSVSYRLVNHGRAVLEARWHVLKLVDGDWYDLTPAGQSGSRRRLVPGAVEQWALSLTRGAAESGTTAVGRLGGGRYAFVVDVETVPSVPAALLAVDAPPLTITPDDDLSVSRDGTTVTVTARDEADSEAATLTVTRQERADRRVIREHVQRHAGLRNTLPFFEDGVERVVLRTDIDTVRNVLGRQQSRSIQVDGDAYRIQTDVSE